jgi:hypothetical protein
MPLTPDELTSLRQACDQLADGPSYRCEEYVTNLLNMALDFQMPSKAVDAATKYFNETHDAKTHDQVEALLARYPNTEEGNLSLAKFLWNYNLWSRAKFLREITKCLGERGIRDQESLARWVKEADFKRDVKGQFRTEKHSIGDVLFHWLQLRCGVDTVKADVHVRKFVGDAIGRPVTAAEAVSGLMTVAKDSGREPHRLDSAIWHFQHDRRTSG